MALSSNTVWEVESGGSDTNGGGFVTGSGGTDYSQQTSPQVSVANAVTAGTTTITSATAGFTSAMVGNILYITGGTGSIAANWYQITGYTNATTITVDRSTGLTTGTGATLKVGGAFATVSNAITNGTNNGGNTIWVKANGTYSLTGNTITVTGYGAQIGVVGYSTTRGDNGQAIFDASGMTAGQNTFSGGGNIAIWNIRVNNSKATAFYGGGGNQQVINCYAYNATSYGFNLVSSNDKCVADTCGTGFGGGVSYFACIAKNCTANGFNNGGSYGSGQTVYCLAYGNTGYGFGNPYQGMHFINCVAYNNTGDGFVGTNNTPMVNCIAYSNGGYGFNLSNSFYWPGTPMFQNDATGNNTSGATTGLNTLFQTTPLVLTTNPFNNAGSGDFSLNNTAGGGASCRAAGFPGVLPVGGTGYLDIGLLQHQDSGGSSSEASSVF